MPDKPGDVIKELARCYAVVLRAGVNNPIHEPEQQLIDRALKLADLLDTLVGPSDRLEWRPRPSDFIVALQEICRE